MTDLVGPVVINKWVDFGERIAWTAIQSAAGAVIVVLTTGVNWKEGLLFVGITTLGAVAKVTVAQRIGDDDLAAIPPSGQRVFVLSTPAVEAPIVTEQTGGP